MRSQKRRGIGALGSSNYKIWAQGGGFNSILARVIGHLKIAEELSLTPFILMGRENYYYDESIGISNVWDYYFEPVSNVDVDAVNRSADFVDSQGRFPFELMPPLFGGEEWMTDIWSKYIRLNGASIEFINSLENQVGPVGSNSLGVHFRGSDMRVTPNHPVPPTLNQIFSAIDHFLETGRYSCIFLVTESEDYHQEFSRRYGDLIQSCDVARLGRGSDIYKEFPRPQHRYLLGFEALAETLLLAKCGSLVCGYSGTSEMARVIGRHSISDVHAIWNGRNPRFSSLARIWWNVKLITPISLGGIR